MRRASLKHLVLQQRPHLIATFRGTTAALAALAAAEYLGLACPFWAAMTALIVIQPTRGLLYEKSFYRLVGTVVGSAAGLLLLLATRSPLILTIAICLWVALCVGLGNLLHGLRSYAALMAGCTCVVISMSGLQNPAHLYDIAYGRVACIIVGIICATLVTALFTPRRTGDELLRRLEVTALDCILWLAGVLRQGRSCELDRREQDILIEVAEIEGLLDSVAAGSLASKRRAREIRGLISSVLSLLGIGRLAGELLVHHNAAPVKAEAWRELLAQHLEELQESVEAGRHREIAAPLNRVIHEAESRLPLLGEALAEMILLLQQVLDQSGTWSRVQEVPRERSWARHRDWREACRAGARAALALGAVGLTWSFSGWPQGTLVLMATSIMVTIFSTKEHPVAFVGQIFLGASTGSLLAVFCRTVLLGGIDSPYLVMAVVAPFVCLGVFCMTQRRTAIPATDATLFFLFTVQPGVAVSLSYQDLQLGAIAMVLGVGVAWASYRYLVPITPAIRLQGLAKAVLSDLEKLAAAPPARGAARLQARLQDRVLRMVSLATRFHDDRYTIAEGGLTALAIARSIVRLREVAGDGRLSKGCEARVTRTLAGLSCLTRGEQAPARVLEDVAAALYELLGPSVLREKRLPDWQTAVGRPAVPADQGA